MNRYFYAITLFSGLLSGCVTPAAIPETVVDVAKQHNSHTETEIIDVHQSYTHISDLLTGRAHSAPQLARTVL